MADGEEDDDLCSYKLPAWYEPCLWSSRESSEWTEIKRRKQAFLLLVLRAKSEGGRLAHKALGALRDTRLGYRLSPADTRRSLIIAEPASRSEADVLESEPFLAFARRI